jgi:hypothetical protein
LPVDVDERRGMAIAVTIVYCGSTPPVTVATSPTVTGALLIVATTTLFSSSGFFAWPLTKRKFKLMVLFDQTGRNDDVRGANRIGDLLADTL